MNLSLSTKRNRGLTLVEVLAVIAVVLIFAAMYLPSLGYRKTRAPRIQCVNNLKQIGLVFRVWEGDNGDKYPMAIFKTNGGTMEFTTGPNVWRHLQVMSNELSTPKVLICPSDLDRSSATNFVNLNNSNLSFFLGLNATETDPQAMLSGDRNITNGTTVRNGILELIPNQPAGWTVELHNKVGNVGLADGSVQQLSITGLRTLANVDHVMAIDSQTAVTNSVAFTNRLQMPILSP